MYKYGWANFHWHRFTKSENIAKSLGRRYCFDSHCRFQHTVHHNSMFLPAAKRYYLKNVIADMCLTCLGRTCSRVERSHVDYRWWSTDVEVRTPHVRTPQSLRTRSPSDSCDKKVQRGRLQVIATVKIVVTDKKIRNELTIINCSRMW